MMGKVPPYLKISCIKGHKESISIVVPAEVNGENNVTVSSKEVGQQTLPEFISFDRSTGTFQILITKESIVWKYHIELIALDTFGGSTISSFQIELVPINELRSEGARYKTRLNVPFIKRDGTALLKLISPAPYGVAQLAYQITNETFRITILTLDNLEVPYKIIQIDQYQAAITIQL